MAEQSTSPSRTYRLGKREEAMEERRAEIISAARNLILSKHALAGFTVDAVAKQAGVTRATVYNQFSSKTGLLEAMFDDLAARGQMTQLPHAFRQGDPHDALDRFIEIFVGFWSADRLITRRLHALAALDAELGEAVGARQARRKQGLRVILGRMGEIYNTLKPEAFEKTLEVLYTLTSFATFDELADTMSENEISQTLQRLAQATLKARED